MYAKLFTSIYQGTLRGNSHGLLVFTNLLAHCDKNGSVDMHPRAIAEEVGLTVEQVRAALLVLESPDDESRSPEEQGRRIVRMDEHRDWGWTVVNYLKYRSIRDEDDRREQNRLSQERWRSKNKPASASVSQDKPASSLVSHVSQDKPIQKQKQEILSKPSASHPPVGGGFAEFWEAWPKSERKQDKIKCAGYWKLHQLDTVKSQILADVRVKRATEKWQGGFIEAPLVYLHGRRWEDGVTPGAADLTPVNREAERSRAYLREQAEHAAKAVPPPANIRELVRKAVRTA